MAVINTPTRTYLEIFRFRVDTYEFIPATSSTEETHLLLVVVCDLNKSKFFSAKPVVPFFTDSLITTRNIISRHYYFPGVITPRTT